MSGQSGNKWPGWVELFAGRSGGGGGDDDEDDGGGRNKEAPLTLALAQWSRPSNKWRRSAKQQQQLEQRPRRRQRNGTD